MAVDNLKGLYIDYLISSTQLTTCTGLSRVLDGAISHDRFTRMLATETFDSRSLWLQNKVMATELARAGEVKVLSIDDSIMAKPHTDENEINCWHFDHCSGKSIKGVGFLSALFNAQGMNVPVMMELIKKDLVVVDEKTGRKKRKASMGKNELFRRMTAQCSGQLYIDYVLADSWFCSNENMKHLFKYRLHFVMAIKSNRLVALSEEDRKKGNWINIESLDLGQAERVVWLKGMDCPLSLTRQVFKNGDGTANLYLVCSDLGLSFDQVTALYKRRWGVEQYHKAVKQVTSFGKSPTKRARTQSNHFYLSIMAYSKMEILKVRANTNEFQLKSRIYLHALKVAMEQVRKLSTNQSEIAA